MSTLGKILLASTVGIIGGFFVTRLLSGTTTGAECCKSSDSCNLPAPTNISASLTAAGLQLTWDAVPEAKYYQVNVVDITSEVAVPSILRTTSEPSIQIAAESLTPTHNYRSSVAAVCNNCTTSSLTTAVDACPIVIEDILMMDRPCLQAGCNCTNPVAAPLLAGGGGFTIGSGKELHKVTVTCSGKTSWFIMQTEIAGGKVIVNVPEYADINDFGSTNCPDCGSYDAPIKSSCGQMTNMEPAYTLTIAPPTATGSAVSFTAGCTFTAVRCTTGCN